MGNESDEVVLSSLVVDALDDPRRLRNALVFIPLLRLDRPAPESEVDETRGHGG